MTGVAERGRRSDASAAVESPATAVGSPDERRPRLCSGPDPSILIRDGTSYCGGDRSDSIVAEQPLVALVVPNPDDSEFGSQGRVACNGV